MKLEVVQKIDNKVMMCTEHKECIDADDLKDIQDSGQYYFKVDGKRTSYRDILESLVGSKHSTALQSASRKVRQIKCKNNGKVYNNMSEAGRDLGIDSALISYSLKVGRPSKGFEFEFVE